MGALLDMMDQSVTADKYQDWKPAPLPQMKGRKEIFIDFETTGLKWWDRDEVCGMAYYFADGECGYVPLRHRLGPNVDLGAWRYWATNELVDVTLTNHTTKFEVHNFRKEGIDLEAQRVHVSDVSHYAALLDDQRKKFSQEVLCEEYLTDEQKVKVIDGVAINPSKMAEYHSGLIAVRGIADVRQVYKLKQAMWPLLDKEDLQRVRQLEDEVIYPTAEMEWNGALIDIEKLNRWVTECKTKLEGLLWDIYRETGLRFNPDSNTDWTKLFQHLNLEIFARTARGRASYTAEVLKQIEHPLVKKGLRAGQLADILSKYLLKYQKTVGSDGILRFALHQLRWSGDDKDKTADEAGTGSGRFSSSAIKLPDGTEVGGNIQQVFSVKKQMAETGADFIIRELFISATGIVGSADAKQIEYRVFADYARTPSVLEAYRKDPNLSFHDLVHGMLLPFKPDLEYKPLKNLNFAKIYGAGLAKICLMLGFINSTQFAELNNEYQGRIPRNHPLLSRGLEVDEIYRRELPEVQPLLTKASNLALERGFVKTLMGRRIRFPGATKEERAKQRPHKALNGVIQGGAADIMKTKMVELHKVRKEIGFLPRFTVHDQVVGDNKNEETGVLLQQVLDRQAFQEMVVPILWDVKTGKNWKDCG